MKPKLLTTLPETTPALLGADLLAGVTVAMVAIPIQAPSCAWVPCGR